MKASYLSLGLFLLAGLAAGCDNISEDERYIKVEKPVIDNPRTLLIMEFTGNSCLNCPTGAKTVEQIKEDEGRDRVIAVGLHPKGSIFTNPVRATKPTPHLQDFRSEAATVWFDYYGKPNGFPTAVFNGLSVSGSIGDWQARASQALTLPASMTIDASCSYDATTRDLTVDYTVDFGNKVDGRLNILIWLVENDIIGTQSMPDGSKDEEYVHNHVLRAALNGDWGASIGDAFYPEDKVEGSATMKLSENWVAENCDAVVFVYRDDNKEVEQAASISIE
ncbi:MAG: Omp28 family outer membrane lipoprotein [Muribaculaceae bacterium]|nr:Omp28 family outer membrane lipoprotein [Muribaculaceae bacterium]